MNGVRRLFNTATNTPPSTTAPVASSSETSVANGSSTLQSPPSPASEFSPTAKQNNDTIRRLPPAQASTRRPQPNETNSQRDDSFSSNGVISRSAKDDLHISLLASESAIECKSFHTLNYEEVQALKKEQRLLASRLDAASKKLILETRMRDATSAMRKANSKLGETSSANRNLEIANKRVETTQKDYLQLNDRNTDISRRLLEHHAGILSSAINLHFASTHGPPAQSGETSPNSTTSSHSRSSSARFGSAHLYANHANSSTPLGARSTERERKALTRALSEEKNKQSRTMREMKHLELEKEERETIMALDLQAAEETISNLRSQTSRIADLQAEMDGLKSEMEERESHMQQTQGALDSSRTRITNLEAELETLSGSAKEWTQMRELHAADLEKHDARRVQLERTLADERRKWDSERQDMELGRDVQISRLEDELSSRQEELDELLESLRVTADRHRIRLSSEMDSPAGITRDFSQHLETVANQLAELQTLKKTMKDDAQKAANVSRQLAESSREVDALRQELRDKTNRSEANNKTPKLNGYRDAEQGPIPDKETIMFELRSLWATLPSPEARASKMGGRSPTRANASPIGSPGLGSSLSELDVRALRSLYDRRTGLPDAPIGEFSLEAFTQRVHAVVADDRALIERLIRFAQSHDLLKNNAERAQRLARESSQALEMYQKQVKQLQERADSSDKLHLSSQNQLRDVSDALDKCRSEKLILESRVGKQSDKLTDLSNANAALSAKTSTPAGEQGMKHKQMESQIAELQQALAKAEGELSSMRSSEATQQTQKAALLDELNSMQTENGKLRDLLRAEQRKNGG